MKTRRHRAAGLAAALAAMVLLSLGCTCCRWSGGTAIAASEQFRYAGKLEQVLRAPLADVHGAVADILRAERLPLLEEQSDAVSGRLKTRLPDGALLSVELEALGDQHTRVTIRPGLKEDERTAADFLDRVCARLLR